MYQEQTDETLLNSIAKERDEKAFEELRERYHSRVGGLCSRYLRVKLSPEDIEECCQEVWCLVWRKAHTFRGDSNPGSWIYVITKRCALMRLRAEKDRIKHLRIIEESKAVFEVTSYELLPQLIAEQFMAKLFLFLSDTKQIPKIYSFCFANKKILQLKNIEAGEKMGISEIAAKSRYHRAKKVVNKWVKKQGYEEYLEVA